MDSNDILDDEKELAEYEESLESLFQMADKYQNMSTIIQTMIGNESINTETVASLESIVPGMLLDNYDIQEVGVFSQEAFTIALEQTMSTELDMAFFLMGKFFKLHLRAAKLLGKQSARLAGVIATFGDSKMVNGKSLMLGTSLTGTADIVAFNYRNLPSGTQARIIKLVKQYTGSDNIGEAEVAKVLAAIKSSKNGIEIMSKVYMPRYSNLLIPLFYIPSSNYKGVVKFFQVMDDDILPKVDSNLNTAIMQLNQVMQSRDWVALSKFSTSIFSEEDKQPMYNLAKNVNVDLKGSSSFRKNCAKTYVGLNELMGSDKKGLKNDPKYHQQLPSSVKDLDTIKTHIISISDTMSDMSKHSESRTGELTRDLRRFRASKTVKESVKGGRSINKYSNAVYSRVMKEMSDVAVLSTFMAKTGNEVIKAYTNVFTRSNALNNDTVKFVDALNKILGK